MRLPYQRASGDYLDFLEAEEDLVVDDAVRDEMNWGETVRATVP